MAIVGGGSTYTPELVEGLCDHEDRLEVDELVLLDPDLERLGPVAGLSERILRHRGWTGRLEATDDRDRALEGAAFVVVQFRVGGQAARLSDETLPHGYGCLGRRPTGPGGLAKALRTVPLVLELAEETATRAAPGRMAGRFHQPGRHRDPGPVSTRATGRSGLCNVARTVQRRLGHYLAGSTPTPCARARRAQPPHLGAHGQRRRGRPVAGAARAFGPELELESGSPLGLIRLLGALPSYYLHYYYAATPSWPSSAPPATAPGRGGGRARGQVARAVRGPGAGDQARAPVVAGRRLLLGSGRPPHGLAPRRHRRRPGGRRAQRRRPPRAARRRRGRGARRWSTATASTRCPSASSRPRCSGSSST